MRKLLERFLEVPDDKLPEEPVDVIVGIGAGLSRAYCKSWRSINLSLQSEKVLSLVIKLFEEKKGKEVFFSGGYNYRGSYEALIMSNKLYEYCLNKGNRRVYSIIETKSRNSLGNAVETLKRMKENKHKSAIVVDFAGHMKQMKRIFLRQAEGTGITLYFVNAYSEYGGNSQTRLNNFYLFFIWEILTNVYYRLTGVL